MHLNQGLRRDIIKHVGDVFFPAEVDETVMYSLEKLFVDYINQSFGSMKPFLPCTPIWLYMTPMDGVLEPIELKVPAFRQGFSVPFVKIAPELNPLVRRRAGYRPPEFDTYRIVMDMCPIPGFADTAEALYSFRRDSLRLKCLLSTELRKSATTESFLKKFPEMKPVMSPWVEDEILDLPVTADIDMSSITFDAVGA